MAEHVTVRVEGFCPACGGSTLFLASGAYVTCSVIDCPNPTIVATLLEDRERNHIVRIDGGRCDVRHPLSERLGDEIEKCLLEDWLDYVKGVAGPLLKSGRYRAYRPGPHGSHPGTSWTFEEVGQ